MIISPNYLLYATDKSSTDLNATFVSISTNLLEIPNSALCDHRLGNSNYPFYR